MREFEKFFTGLQRDYGFCNVDKIIKITLTAEKLLVFNPVMMMLKLALVP
jgi:hypothetical protein